MGQLLTVNNPLTSKGESEENYGYKVVMLFPNSPATEIGLVPFFDIVIAVDGKRMV